ncbi:MAG: methyltransferase domain-containing protein [Plectolyngbya sp. WJT66-NPBG17]|jgi:ubiquinone/menaquinone biosynthesis C-methylase UbiE/flagellar biosynthesis chaperone FliJ|nr:methyltransferase domain-containing protein [Plectolyngbya sp. WJT66-NPBG17]
MMEFTGERFVPQLSGDIKYEHLHRYAISLDFVEGRSVLDIASGEGYGSALLAKRAGSVVGVDIDSASIDYARSHYGEIPNLKFLVGSCSAIPITDASIDVVVSFETIEHHDQHEEMMQEIKRVLKPDGILILSSPNRLVYSDEPKQANPFHVKELYYEELVDLLKRYFQQMRLYGQKLAVSSWMMSIESSQVETIKAYSGDVSNIVNSVDALPAPMYFVAVCSDRAVKEPLASLYLDMSDDLWKRLNSDRHSNQIELSHLRHEFNHLQHQFNQIQHDRNHLQHRFNQLQYDCSQLQDEFSQTQHNLNQLQHDRNHSQHQFDQLQHTLNQAQHQLQECVQVQQNYQNKLQHADAVIQAMESSKFWKLRQFWMRVKALWK